MVSSEKTPLVYLTRIEKFSSAHKLYNNSLDNDQNVEIFDKCSNIHGHNYTVEITIKGPVDNKTGMVLNMNQFKSIIQSNVLDHLDHRFIDQDVEYFKQFNNINKISTSENICVFIWEQISKNLPLGIELHCIKLHETEKNIVKYYGEYQRSKI